MPATQVRYLPMCLMRCALLARNTLNTAVAVVVVVDWGALVRCAFLPSNTRSTAVVDWGALVRCVLLLRNKCNTQGTAVVEWGGAVDRQREAVAKRLRGAAQIRTYVFGGFKYLCWVLLFTLFVFYFRESGYYTSVSASMPRVVSCHEGLCRCCIETSYLGCLPRLHQRFSMNFQL